MEYEALKKVGEIYLETESVKETADRCKISELKARRILITLGMWSSASSKRIHELSKQGYSAAQIAEELSLSVKAVEAYLPYRRGAYGLDEKSADAIRSELYRERKKVAEDHMMKKNDTGETLDAVSDEAWKQLIITDSDVKAVPERRVSFVFTEGAVCHLRFELVESDEMTDAEKKVAKAQRAISRDVLAPGSMSLHVMHYMIQKLFGWQNAHLHHFSLRQEDFDLVTAGRFGTYADLCGTLFRFPSGDTADMYWDDDYDNSVSVKTWLKSKYSNLCVPQAISDTWVGNQQTLQAFRADFQDVGDDMLLSELQQRIMFEQDMNQLSERMSVAEIFTASNPRPDVRFWKARFVSDLRKMQAVWEKEDQDEIREAISQLSQWRNSFSALKQQLWYNPEETRRQIKKKSGMSAEKMIEKHEQAIAGWSELLYHVFNKKYNVPLMPFFESINYFYDYGDNWQVRISVVDVYKAQTGVELGGGWECPFNIEDKKAMEYSRYYHADGHEVEGELRDKLATIFFKHVPICIAADGLNVLDDCGGLGGYVNMLETIYGRDKEESGRLREWANSMGWTGRRTRPENML